MVTHYSLKVEMNKFIGKGTHILYVVVHSQCIKRGAKLNVTVRNVIIFLI